VDHVPEGPIRFSEIVLGLQRQDVDLLDGTVNVERTYTMVSGVGPIVGPPKTEAGRRRTGIPENVRPILAGHMDLFVAPSKTAWLPVSRRGSQVSARH
jgi:hypothetical protein